MFAVNCYLQYKWQQTCLKNKQQCNTKLQAFGGIKGRKLLLLCTSVQRLCVFWFVGLLSS